MQLIPPDTLQLSHLYLSHPVARVAHTFAYCLSAHISLHVTTAASINIALNSMIAELITYEATIMEHHVNWLRKNEQCVRILNLWRGVPLNPRRQQPCRHGVHHPGAPARPGHVYLDHSGLPASARCQQPTGLCTRHGTADSNLSATCPAHRLRMLRSSPLIGVAGVPVRD